MTAPTRSVEALLSGLGRDQRAVIEELREVAKSAAPRLGEAVKWGQLCLVDDHGKAVLALIPHRRHANVQLFQATGLVDRFPQLEGTGKGARHLKCPYDRAVDRRLVQRLVRAAVRTMKAGPS